MNFFATLQQEAAAERDYLLSSPIIGDALAGQISTAQYVAFLKEAYFHVSQTVPLLMACGSRLDASHEWLRKAVAHYIEDEYGHEKWIEDDIRACGADPTVVCAAGPSRATEIMVSYAWDTVQRRNPVGFFGMVYVLEGTSVALATNAAAKMRTALGLPESAFTYLDSHGSIDRTHIRFLEDLLSKVDTAGDREAITHAAKRFFYLYAEIFRTLPDRAAALQRPELEQVA